MRLLLSKHIKVVFPFLLMSVAPVYYANAQLFSGGTAGSGLDGNQKIISDSSRKKQINTDDKLVIVQYQIQDTAKVKPDSTIAAFHRNPLVPVWFSDLGNVGSAGTSLKYIPSMEPHLTLGIVASNPYLFQWKQTIFYNTTRPYTDIYYRVGSKTEQIISILHTQNVKPGWNINANYRKINSPGFYKWQRTNHDNFKLSTHYISTNLRYDLKAGFLYNKLQQDENGGILSEEFLYSESYNDKRLIPVRFENISANRSGVTNYFRDVSFNVLQQYYFGKRDSVYNADSTELNYRFRPVFSFKHHLYTKWDYYQYKDLQPDSSTYSRLQLSEFAVKDSLYTKYFHKRIGNSISLNGDIRVGDKVMQAEAGYGVELEKIENKSVEQFYYNNYVFAQLLKPRQGNREWLYQARMKFYFTGNALGNFNFHAEAGRNMGSTAGTLLAGIAQSLQTAPYMFTHFESNYFLQQNNFQKQSISRLFLQYLNPEFHGALHFNYYMLGNYLYRDTNFVARQYGSIIPLIQLQIDKAFYLGSFVFDNQVLIQGVGSSSPLRVPLFASRHRLAVEDYIFKKKLQIATGFELRYNTPYFADRYAPLYYGFVTQYTQSIANVPEVSYFFNFKVKRFRSSVSFDQLQQIFTRNNIQYPDYAAQNFGLRFGLSWVFVN